VGQFDKLLSGYQRRADQVPATPGVGGMEPCTWAALGVSVAIQVYMSKLMLPLAVTACLALCGAGFARSTRMPLLSAVFNILIVLLALTLLWFSLLPEIRRALPESANLGG
jgi:hypothetical protein